tara:strand:+ start:2508 stop:3194 length:687 start_codon:yes stop_codon:yes gene_type:complete
MTEKDQKKIAKILDTKSVFVFDFDGVLADSVNIKTSAFFELYREYGHSVSSKVIEHHEANGGMSRFDKFKFYHRNFLNIDLKKKEIEDLSARFSSLVLESVIKSPEIKGAGEFLKKNYQKNKLFFINSATPELEIKEVIKSRNLDSYFTEVFGSPNSKLDNLRTILSRYNIDVTQIVFFGDALSDFDAANSLGCMFVGVGRHIEEIISSRLTVPVSQYYLLKDFQELL